MRNIPSIKMHCGCNLGGSFGEAFYSDSPKHSFFAFLVDFHCGLIWLMEKLLIALLPFVLTHQLLRTI